jgi:hypothetical protein
VEKEAKRDYKRPQLVKFGRADRLTERIVLPSGLRDSNSV